MQKKSELTEQSIAQLVGNFYTKVREDKKLGEVFSNAIGGDDQDWKPHLQKMVDFWSSLMLSSGKYHGNPFKKHKDLPPFDIKLFDRWLELFAETAHELYNEELAEHFIEKGARVAESLKAGLYFKPEAPKT